MSERRKVFYLYSKDPSMMEDGSRSPVPKKLRQRRQVFAGIIEGGTLRIGKAECSHEDVFRKVTGRNKATGLAISAPMRVITLKKEDDPGKVFVETAKALITPAPAVEIVTCNMYRKARQIF